MTTPVNFEIAKLLKEKGFDVPIQHTIKGQNYVYDEYTKDFVRMIDTNAVANWNDSKYVEICSAPTIAEVVMWLYEKHGIWISVDMVFGEDQTGFWYCIRESKEYDVAIQSDEYNTVKEAYESSFMYILKKL